MLPVNGLSEHFFETAKDVAGYRQNKIKEWLTISWYMAEDRWKKQLKNKLLNTKSPRLQHQIQKAFKNKDKKVMKSARSGKGCYVEELADEAEQAAVRGEMSVAIVYKITKLNCGNNTNYSAPVKDKNGKAFTRQRKQTARWVKHFQEVLNRPEPDKPAKCSPPHRLHMSLK